MTIGEQFVGTNKAEGRTTHSIEQRTSRVPSGAYLALAIGAMAASAAIMVRERTTLPRRMVGGFGLANFVGQWAPTILILGLYNKIVKLEAELTGVR